VSELRMWGTQPRRGWISAVLLALFCAVSQIALAGSLDKTALIGRWDYTSYTVLKEGRPSGTVQFKPGTLVFTYHQDETWEMEANDATHTQLNGYYEVRRRQLIMRKSDGSPYQDCEVEMKDGGKAMIMKDKRSIVTATKVETAR